MASVVAVAEKRPSELSMNERTTWRSAFCTSLRTRNSAATTSSPMTSLADHCSEIPPQPVLSAVGTPAKNAQHRARALVPSTDPLVRQMASTLNPASNSTMAATTVAITGSRR